MPGGSVVDGVSRTVPGCGSASPPVTRASEGRTRASRNHRSSSGWWMSTGLVVVGRSTPERLTSRRRMELTSVDLPDPVDPPTTASSGASIDWSLGIT